MIQSINKSVSKESIIVYVKGAKKHMDAKKTVQKALIKSQSYAFYFLHAKNPNASLKKAQVERKHATIGVIR